MSINHKAFVFDFSKFAVELLPKLEEALMAVDSSDLRSFIEQNREALKDPYEGEPLDDNWVDMIEGAPDAHQLGDFALTKYYDPAVDVGIGAEWIDIQGLLISKIPNLASMLLGSPVGGHGAYFDPGKMGSYFHTPAAVQKCRQLLDAAIESNQVESSNVGVVWDMLNRVPMTHGLYTTF